MDAMDWKGQSRRGKGRNGGEGGVMRRAASPLTQNFVGVTI